MSYLQPKLLFVAALVGASFIFSSCSEDEPTKVNTMPADLVAYFDYDGDVNENTGIYTGSLPNSDYKFVADKNGSASKALDMSNQVDVIYSGFDPKSSTNETTIAFWIKPSVDLNQNTNSRHIVAEHVGGYFQTYYIYGQITFEIYNESHTPWTYSVTTNMTASTWYHVAITVKGNGGVSAMYIDGVKQFTGTFDSKLQATSHALYIGSTYGASLNGAVDEFMVFKRALTETEIKDLKTNYPAK